jgi:hypothetical protein
LSIINGELRQNGEHLRWVGSESICYWCRKRYTCRAFEDDYTVDYPVHPLVSGKVVFSQLYMISQILKCPIDQFEYRGDDWGGLVN